MQIEIEHKIEHWKEVQGMSQSNSEIWHIAQRMIDFLECRLADMSREVSST